MRTIQVTVTLTGTVPHMWLVFSNEDLERRAGIVAEDAMRRLFERMEGVTVKATATVEGGDHE